MDVKVNESFRKLIPPLSEAERRGLEESLVREGCLSALVVWKEEGILLDGHHRYAICQEHGIDFATAEVSLPNRDAAEDWIDQSQSRKRNLKPDQIYVLMGRRHNRAERQRDPSGKFCTMDQTASELAVEYGVHEKTVKNAAAFYRDHPKEAGEVLRGEKTRLEVGRDLKQKAQAAKAAAAPTGTYRVIYADPPWKYHDQLAIPGKNGNAESYGPAAAHYPQMSINELCDIQVIDIAQDDAVLFLWTTSPMLEVSFEVIHAWGFEYKTSFVWDKVKHNMGHYNSVRHEFLLVATRGSCTPDTKKLFDSVQTIERTTRHSEKPSKFREIIDTLYPHGSRIELFARTRHDNWEAWGKEA